MPLPPPLRPRKRKQSELSYDVSRGNTGIRIQIPVAKFGVAKFGETILGGIPKAMYGYSKFGEGVFG